MAVDLKWFIVILGNCLLLFFTHLTNDTLAPLSLNLYFYGLFVFYPAVRLDFLGGLTSIIITGLIIDSTGGYTMGTNTLTLTFIFTFWSWFREEFNAHSPWHNVLIVQSSNLLSFLTLSIYLGLKSHIGGYYWLSALINLTLSQLLLIVVGPWFFSIQDSLIRMTSLKPKRIEGEKE